jgi:DNA-directed RNA polymerase specialized sigma24 family protein
MDQEAKELLESIDNRLKWLLQLRVEEQFDDGATNKEKVKLLHQMGFSSQEMAEVVGTSASSIRGTVSTLRDEGEIDS